jgi:hypothetical protein
MPLYELAIFAIAAAILLSATTMLNSRALTEKLVGRNMISRFVAELFPVFASGCRVLGAFLVALGLCWAGVNSGYLSREMVERFGPPVLAVGVGIFMLVRFRKQ